MSKMIQHQAALAFAGEFNYTVNGVSISQQEQVTHMATPVDDKRTTRSIGEIPAGYNPFRLTDLRLCRWPAAHLLEGQHSR